MKFTRQNLTVLNVVVDPEDTFGEIAYQVLNELHKTNLSTVLIDYVGIGFAVAEMLKSKGVSVIKDSRHGAFRVPGKPWRN